MAKRILLYCTQLMETGGIENHVLEFISKMKSRGLEIDIIVANFQMKPPQEQKIRKNCKHVYIQRKQSRYYRQLWLIYTAFSLRPERYESLYTNGQGESIAVLAGMIRYKNWVHHHHTSGDMYDRKTWGNLYRKSLKNADSVIACSLKNAGEIGIAVDREIQTIACFSRKITLPEKRIDSTRLRFGYFGRLIPEKGINILCKLSKDPDCADLEFHLWGEGKAYPEAYFNQFPKVFYNGTFASKKDLKKVINSLDGFLLLSVHAEGLPVSLLESMGAGLPWLATDKGGISDIACDPVSTRVISFKSSYEEIKTAVLDFASDLQLGKVSRVKQQELYNTRFSSEVLVKQWRTILQV